jgi:hypothetical protein
MSEFVLKLDVDRARREPRWKLERLAAIVHLAILDVQDERSPGGKGWHRVIRVRALDPRARWRAADRVAVQLLFGSDVWREAYTLHRARLVDARQVAPFWRSRWNVLYATTSKRRASPRRGPA